MKKKNTIRSVFLVGVACVALAACETTSFSEDHEQRAGDIDAALDRAAHTAAVSSGTTESAAYLERVYKRNSEDSGAAMNYARALRKEGYLKRASLVLEPFAIDPDASTAVKAEFSAIELALGNNKSAERYAQQAVLKDPGNYKAYHFLGVALDAQGKHDVAERAFRKGLELWQSDPTSIMNNLALNLTSQGYFDEAAEILEQAKIISPDVIEVERNLRIVRALQQSEGGAVPKPSGKPN